MGAPRVPENLPSAKERKKDEGLQNVDGMLREPCNVVHNDERVAIFIDAANTDRGVRDEEFILNPKKALELFNKSGIPYNAFYFTADFTREDTEQAKFLDYLADIGYVVRKKPVKVITDPTSKEKVYKSNVDIEMAVDLLNTVENWDVAFLFTGDSDFERCIDVLRSRGKRIYVVSTRRHISRELRQAADKPVFYLEDYKQFVAWDAAARDREVAATA